MEIDLEYRQQHRNDRATLGITNDARKGFCLTRVVVKPDQHRVVPLQVTNMSQNPIELAAGQNIAYFSPLVESCSEVLKPEPDVRGAVQSELLKSFTDKVDSVLDSHLAHDDRERVQRLLYKFLDVFDESLDHTTLLTRKIDTGNSPTIK